MSSMWAQCIICLLGFVVSLKVFLGRRKGCKLSFKVPALVNILRSRMWNVMKHELSWTLVSFLKMKNLLALLLQNTKMSRWCRRPRHLARGDCWVKYVQMFYTHEMIQITENASILSLWSCWFLQMPHKAASSSTCFGWFHISWHRLRYVTASTSISWRSLHDPSKWRLST